ILWDLHGPAPRHSTFQGTGPFAFSHDGTMFAFTHKDRSHVVLDLARSPAEVILRTEKMNNQLLLFGPDKGRLYAFGVDQKWFGFDLKGAQPNPTANWPASRFEVNSSKVAIRRDGARLAHLFMTPKIKHGVNEFSVSQWDAGAAEAKEISS